MERLNLTEVETRFGYKSFELWQGDLTQIEERIDGLIVSAIPDNYELVPRTVICALHDALGIDVGALAKDKELDFRSLLDCWVSKALSKGPFGRVLCVETVRGPEQIKSTLENVFVFLALLEAKGIDLGTFALPVLGAGNQKLDPAQVIATLVPCALRHLERSLATHRILFVAYRMAEAEILSKAMDEHLGRIRIVAKNGPIEEGLRKELDRLLSHVAHLPSERVPPNLAELRTSVLSEESRALEIGISSRRLVEFMVSRLLKKKGRGELLADIEALSTIGVAPWIRSYMHTLRVIGNEQAHSKNVESRHPGHITDRDLTACLFCLQRVLDFWVAHG
jgi:hypothetical protein